MVLARNRTHLKNLIRAAIKEKGEYCDLNFIDVSRVTDMHGLFAKSKFKGDISKWDVYRVTNMCEMFSNSEFNGDISDWDVSEVIDMHRMFADSKFNGDLSKWDVPKVKYIGEMFKNSPIEERDRYFEWYTNYMNRPYAPIVVRSLQKLKSCINEAIKTKGLNTDLNFIDVSQVTDMHELFTDSEFNGDISEWDVSNVTDMYEMFANSKFDGDLSKWNVSRVRYMGNMFVNTPIEERGQYFEWYTKYVNRQFETVVVRNRDHLESLVNRALLMFGSRCDLNFLDVSNVTDMHNLFEKSDFNGDISKWDVSNVTDMYRMFADSKFNGDLNNWNVDKVDDMDGIFSGSELEWNKNYPKWYV